jgi:hypothetical protein
MIFVLRQAEVSAMQSLDRPRGFQEFEAPRFQDSRRMKLVRLSALHIFVFEVRNVN